MCLTQSNDSIALFNSVHHIRTSLIAGTNLPTLLKKADYYLEIMKRHGNTWGKTIILLYRETISMLIGASSNKYAEVRENALQFPAEIFLYHKAYRAYWIGHSERCQHFSEKLIQGSESGGRQHRRFFMLYYGLNSFKIMKRSSSQKLKAIPRNALKALKTTEEHSKWNFRNKVSSID